MSAATAAGPPAPRRHRRHTDLAPDDSRRSGHERPERPGDLLRRRRRSRSSGRTARRSSCGCTTTCTSPTRSRRCTPTSAAGGSSATTCSAASARRSPSDWISKIVNGYVYTAAIPAQTGLTAEASEYGARYTPRVPLDATTPAEIGAYLGWTLPVLRGELPRLVARPAAPGDGAQLRPASTSTTTTARAWSSSLILLEDAIDMHDRHWSIHWMLNFAQFSSTTCLKPPSPRPRARATTARCSAGCVARRRTGTGTRSRSSGRSRSGSRTTGARLRDAFAEADRRRRPRGAGGHRGRPGVPGRAIEPTPASSASSRCTPTSTLQDLAREPRPDRRDDPRLPRDRLRLPRRARRPCADDLRAGQGRGARGRRGRPGRARSSSGRST